MKNSSQNGDPEIQVPLTIVATGFEIQSKGFPVIFSTLVTLIIYQVTKCMRTLKTFEEQRRIDYDIRKCSLIICI
jgi:hypothetical protein